MSVDERSLFRKVRILPKKGLGRIVECVLVLWALLADPAVPTWAKALVAAALAYLICPFDAVPDFLPAGFVDDAAVIVSTFARVSGYVSGEHRERASRKRRELGL